MSFFLTTCFVVQRLKDNAAGRQRYSACARLLATCASIVSFVWCMSNINEYSHALKLPVRVRFASTTSVEVIVRCDV